MNFLKNFPLKRFKIKNDSMVPFLKERDEVLTISYFFFGPKVGDVIVFRQMVPPFILCKRIVKIINSKIWVEGDNGKKSIDSRNFGFIEKKNIIGKMFFKL